MMTDTCLNLTGAIGPTIIEGPFAHNSEFKSMLAAATGRPVFQVDATTGTAIGAALLFSQGGTVMRPISHESVTDSSQWRTYADKWRSLANSKE